MTVQNLISATIAPETKTEIMQMLAEIKSKLGFLLTLQPAEIQALVKAGNAYAPFIDKAYNTINAYPDIMPAVFDAEEFKRDYTLFKDLTIIAENISQINDSVHNTLLAANSDAMNASLDVYANVKHNRDRVPGLNVVAEEMGEFFKRPKRKGEASAKK